MSWISQRDVFVIIVFIQKSISVKIKKQVICEDTDHDEDMEICTGFVKGITTSMTGIDKEDECK